jgi:hypothetical protein
MIPALILTFEKKCIEFHREFYFCERFEKRVFPTDPLSRTDTFGTHCTCLYKQQINKQNYRNVVVVSLKFNWSVYVSS